jgi:hemerythrin superfamily protein
MAARKKAAPRAIRQDAIALLKAEHREVEDLFERFESARTGARKEAIAAEVCAKLTVHAQVEEELFYPAARSVLPAADEDLVDEATVEHQTVKDLIAKIGTMSAADDLYEATVKVLSEYVKHHVKEEEQELFPKLRKREVDLTALGQRMAQRRDELLARVERVGRPPKGRTGAALSA